MAFFVVEYFEMISQNARMMGFVLVVVGLNFFYSLRSLRKESDRSEFQNALLTMQFFSKLNFGMKTALEWVSA